MNPRNPTSTGGDYWIEGIKGIDSGGWMDGWKSRLRLLD